MSSVEAAMNRPPANVFRDCLACPVMVSCLHELSRWVRADRTLTD